MTIGLNTIDQLTRRRLGTFDVPCPLCGSYKRTTRGQRKPVLRVWRSEEGFASFHCARCGESGYAHDRKHAPTDREKLAKARAEADARARTLKAERLKKARWLWSQRRPIAGSIAEGYLRDARGYSGQLPTTLAFLPARGRYSPSMIAAFGLANETEPGVIAIRDDAVVGVHLTRLRPDGSGKAVFEDPDEPSKIMVGFSMGSPIVLAPPNDLLGLAVTEGIEDGLSVYESASLGVWAAGAATRMPALANSVPHYIEVVTVVADDDADGRRHAGELANRLAIRGIETRAIVARAFMGFAG
jgi:hypothetical protein